MKTFFDSIFIDGSNPYEEAEYPMKIEYYKTIETEENVKAKYGLEVVKTEFLEGKVNVESKRLENIAKSVEEIDKILAILKNNEVTPIGIQDIMDELCIDV